VSSKEVYQAVVDMKVELVGKVELVWKVELVGKVELGLLL